MSRYEVIIYWSDEDEAFIAEVPELPGCMADGATYQEALTNAETVIREWVETARDLRRSIPEPAGRRTRRERPRALSEQIAESTPAVLLTRRELQVLSLVIEGLSSKEVADALSVSKRTVDFHLARIYDKLQVSNRVQAMSRVISLGLRRLQASDLAG